MLCFSLFVTSFFLYRITSIHCLFVHNSNNSFVWMRARSFWIAFMMCASRLASKITFVYVLLIGTIKYAKRKKKNIQLFNLFLIPMFTPPPHFNPTTIHDICVSLVIFFFVSLFFFWCVSFPCAGTVCVYYKMGPSDRLNKLNAHNNSYPRSVCY